MKNILYFILLIGLVSCKKDKEILTEKNVDSTKLVRDSIQIPNINNGNNIAFQINPQEVKEKKGKAVFQKNGSVLFYFDQNANEGNIKIDGKVYVLNKFDFTENNYLISGSGVSIEATNGEFKEQTNGCLEADFPEVKIVLGDKTVQLNHISVQDCPVY